jgi:uracil-DNA glycosylase family 4
MSDTFKQILQDAHRWLDQERVWGEDVYATGTAVGLGNQRIEEAAKQQAANPPLRRPTVPPSRSAAPTRPVSIPPRSSPEDVIKKTIALKDLYEKYKECTRCPLGTTRLKFVFGVGNPDAQVLFIGEGPGYEEDHRGEPFIGKAGQLLDKMIEAIGLSRKMVYIANIVKCHAMINPQTPNERGNDRAPTALESETCSPILQQQIEIIKPRIIVTLGSPSTRSTLGTLEGITKIRGRFFPLPMTYFKRHAGEADLFEKKSDDDFAGFSEDRLAPLTSIQVLPMYHPAALLRNPNLKKDAWEDMKLLRNTLLQNPA